MGQRKRRSRWLHAAALLLGLTAALVPAPAQAQGQEAGAAAKTEAMANARAAELFNQGRTAAKAGDWQKAYESFLAAWKVKEQYQIAANLGRAEMNIGKYKDAAEHFAYFLREARNPALELQAGQARQVGIRFGAEDEDGAAALAPAKGKPERPLFGGDTTLLVASGVVAGVCIVNGIIFAAAADRNEDGLIAAATANFVGAGVVGISTFVYALIAPKAGDPTALRVVPVADAQGGGLSLSW